MDSPEDILEMIAKVKIHEVLARYARGIDRHDYTIAKSAYHEDGYDEHGPFRGNAHDVLDKIEKTLTDMEVSQHKVSNILIELEGDRANVESYFFSLHIPQGSEVEEHVYGRYIDVMERREGVWKIAKRRVVVDFTSCPPRGKALYGEDTFSRGTRDKQDPSYELFGA